MKKKCAVFTFIQNGHEYFKIWYRYYSRFFDLQDIYVLDLGSTDGCLDGRPCNVVSIAARPVIPEGNLMINQFKTTLLKDYQYVIYVDYDEILYHPLGLDKYLDVLDRLDIPYVTASGYDIVHRPKVEPAFDFSKTILSQRGYWRRVGEYDKSLITSKDFHWDMGCHTVTNHPPMYYTRELLLLHYHKLDYAYVEALNNHLRSIKSPLGGGSQLVGKELFHWWEGGNPIHAIPKEIREADFV